MVQKSHKQYFACCHSEVVKQNDQIETLHDDALETKDNMDKVREHISLRFAVHAFIFPSLV
jgi:hypothetical protein